jgi:hypothetical protein
MFRMFFKSLFRVNFTDKKTLNTALCSSETSESAFNTTQCYNSEGYNQRCENVKAYDSGHVWTPY